MRPQRKGHPTPRGVEIHRLRPDASEDPTAPLRPGRACGCKPEMPTPVLSKPSTQADASPPGHSSCPLLPFSFASQELLLSKLSLTLNPCDRHIFLTK